MPSEQNNLYSNYVSWKQWDQSTATMVEREQFDIEMSRARLPKGARILEVGFGRGDFLDWGRERNFAMSGIEIIPALVTEAQSRGHRAYLGSLAEISPKLKSQFDCVVMFDVLEHLSIDGIIEYFRHIHDLLRPGGSLIVRVPNAASIAGLLTQTGDITHVTALSVSSFEQFALMTQFRLEYNGNAARSYSGGRRPGRMLYKRVAYVARDLIETFIGYLYYGARIPLDPNITVVLRRH